MWIALRGCVIKRSLIDLVYIVLDDRLYKSSAVAEMGDRGHKRHGPKRGGCCARFARELGPRLTQCGLGRGLLPYQVASSYIQPFGHNTPCLKKRPTFGLL